MALRKNFCKFNNSDKKRYCERLEKQPLKFFTVYNKYRNLSSSSTVSLLKWSVAEWKQTDRAGSAQSVGVHDLQLAKNSVPVEQKNIFCKFKKEVEGIFKRSRVEVESDDSFKEETR